MWILFRKIDVGSCGSWVLPEKIHWLRWVFDHYRNVFDGWCESLELPVTFFSDINPRTAGGLSHLRPAGGRGG